MVVHSDEINRPRGKGNDQNKRSYDQLESTPWVSMPSIHSNTSDGIRVPYSNFALIGINGSGRLRLHTSPRLEKYRGAIFTPEFRNFCTRNVGVKIVDQPASRFGDSGTYPGRASLAPHELDYQVHPSKKRRLEGFHSLHLASDEENILRVPIKIGDTEKIIAFYENSFKTFQQINCRQVAKAYIKLIEPRKQVKHPYNGGRGALGEKGDPEKTKPDWWPPGVVHREPDHLKKPERIRLLIHIFRSLGESHGMTADKLEEAGRDAQRQIKPRERLEILDEIYRVRRLEESYERGEIDGNTIIYVANRDVTTKVDRDSESDGSTHGGSNTNETSKRTPKLSHAQEENCDALPTRLSKTSLQRPERAPNPFYQPPNLSEFRMDSKPGPQDPGIIEYFPQTEFVPSPVEDHMHLRNSQPWSPFEPSPIYSNMAYPNNGSQLVPHILSTQPMETPSLSIQQHNGMPLPESPHSSRSHFDYLPMVPNHPFNDTGIGHPQLISSNDHDREHTTRYK
ncbi:hypothetical protein FQN57_005252 [Myotisia sp. PD_48]|nr:hypothetical protein FQN57_005252 [Myotisia sp. PD_48]